MPTNPITLALIAFSLAITFASQPLYAQGTASQADVLERLAEIELLITVERRFDAAETALAELFPSEEIADERLQDAEVAAATARIEKLIADGRQPDTQRLEESIREALALNRVNDFGKRAVPVLVRMVETGEMVRTRLGGPPRDVDPLFALTAIDPDRALQLVAERRAAGDPINAFRVFHAGQNVLVENSAHWTSIPGAPPRFAHPEWMELLASLLLDPDVVDGSVPLTASMGPMPTSGVQIVGALLGRLYRNQAYTPSMLAAMEGSLRLEDGRVASRVLEIMGNEYRQPALKPLQELALDHEDPAVRLLAAERLADFEHSAALLARADDPDPRVRTQVAWSLRIHQYETLTWNAEGRADNRRLELVPTMGAAEQELLVALSHDEDAGVRLAVVAAANSWPEALLDADDYRRLAHDSSLSVRAALVGITAGDVELETEIRTLLAADPEPFVLKTLDEWLERADWDRDQQLAPVLRARLEHATHSINNELAWVDGSFWSRLLQSEAVREELARLTLQTGDPSHLDRVLEWDSVRSFDLDSLWPGLEAGEFVRVLPLVHERAPVTFFVLSINLRPRPIVTISDGLADAMRALLVDPTVNLTVRAAAAKIVAGVDGRESIDALVALTAEPELQEWSPDDDRFMDLESLPGRWLVPEDRNALALRLLESGEMPSPMAEEFVRRYEPVHEGGREVTLAILERWPGYEMSAAKALQSARSFATEVDPDTLMAAAESSTVSVAVAGLKAMGATRDPVYLPVMERALEPLFDLPGANDRNRLFEATLDAITGYMSDDAAEILLRAASKMPNQPARDACMQAVSQILDYQQMKAGWERRLVEGGGRDTAVADLVALLGDDDPAVRAQAARGLGTLGAVDQLPRLIRLMADDDDEAVREAARVALDALNGVAAEAGDG